MAERERGEGRGAAHTAHQAVTAFRYASQTLPFKVSVLHPKRGREQTGSRGGQGALHRYPGKSSLTHLTSEALDKKKRRFKEMYLKDTEVAESRRNVNVHTSVLLVTQHPRSCSPAYAHG